MVDTDRVTGAAKELAGKVQGAVGDLVGSKSDSAQGRAREVQGAAENAYGHAKDTVRDVAGRASDTAKDLGDKVRSAVDDIDGREVSRRAGQAREAAEGYYDRAEDVIRGAADQAYDYAEDAYENTGRYLDEGRRVVSHRVGENPLTALLIAGAVGFGLGLLINTRR